MIGLEALRYAHEFKVGRRDFLKGVGAAALTFALNPEIAAAADTSVETFTDPAVVAGLYGWDTISKDARFWRPAGDGGWVFDSTLGDGKTFQGDGKPHGIFVAGADGCGAELTGWLKVKTPAGDFTGLVVAHRNALLVEAIQATIYRHKDPLAGWVKLADEARNNRQPGQIWMPVNEGPGITNSGDIPLFSIGTKEDAVRMFGVPGTLGADPNNWEVFDGGPTGDRFAKLKSPNGLNIGIKLTSPDGKIWPEGALWPVAQGAIAKDGSLPTLFAAHPDVREVFGTEITVRLTTNPSASWRNSLTGLRAQRTGLNILPIVR